MSRCKELVNLSDSIKWAITPEALRTIVNAALSFAAPKVDQGQLEKIAGTLVRGGGDADDVHRTLGQVSRRGLPEVWLGTTSSLACDVVEADAKGIDDVGDILLVAGRDVWALSDDLTSAKARFEHGRSPLSHALSLIDAVEARPAGGLEQLAQGDGLAEARTVTQEGIDDLYAGWAQAEDAAHRFVRQMKQYAMRANAQRAPTQGMSAADRIVLGEAAVPGAWNDETILMPADMRRVSAAMDKLSAGDRRSLTTLLAQSRSSQERAYILKALAAGHSLDDVRAFDKLIHPHAHDALWLKDRLSPVAGQSAVAVIDAVEFEKKGWAQGDKPTCVAGSIVIARAMLDPLYALQLTTGGHPGDPKFDSGAGFARRLADEQQRLYDDARPWTADLPIVGYDGVETGDSEKLVDRELGPYVGDYTGRDLSDAGDRRDVLPDIYAAVDSGKPVPFSVRSDIGGHKMVIVGHDGNRLQIYNPWGFTTWVTDEDFINNHMDNAASGLNEAVFVHLPR